MDDFAAGFDLTVAGFDLTVAGFDLTVADFVADFVLVIFAAILKTRICVSTFPKCHAAFREEDRPNLAE